MNGSPPGSLTGLRRADAEQAKLHRRFDRMARLVGDEGMRTLASADVMVVGIGGVGSWAAEALVRAGVGRLRLIDFDLVCVTNANRQLHAMRGTTGKPKVDVMAERLRTVNPAAEVVPERAFYEADSADRLFERAPDFVVDAIDNLTAKTDLIARCRERGIPVVVAGGASGRMDPTQIRVSDLTEVRGDPFIARTRKMLRKNHAFPDAESGAWGIACVHSLEPCADPLALEYDGDEGFRCVCPQGENGQHTCDARRLIYGTAGFVTGAFGLACAAEATRALLADPT